MSDEFVARYQGMSHRELFNMLKAGSPGQVKDLAAKWQSLQGSMSDLSATVRTDLAKLGNGWSGSAGQEFRSRLELITTFAADLADDLHRVQSGLNLVADSLTEAQSKAEDPAATDDNDKAIQDGAMSATAGAAVAGPPGALVFGAVGAWFGHQQDEAEKEKAHQRMIQLVAGLAADYETVGGGVWPGEAVQAPGGTPGGTDGSGATPGGLGSIAGVAGVAALRAGSAAARRTTSPTPVNAAGPGSGGDADSTGAGTSLLGAGSAVVGSGLLTTAAMGGVLGVGVPGQLPSGRPGGGPSGAGAGTTGTAAASAPVGHNEAVLGGRESAQAGRQAATGGGRSLAGTGTGTDEETDERLTWLTEDEMVWGGDVSAAPAVLGGGQPAADQPAAGQAAAGQPATDQVGAILTDLRRRSTGT